MAYTLFHAMLEVARYALPRHAGAATAQGTTSTLIDTVRKLADDQVNNGVLCFLTGTYANQFKTITDYVNSSGTFTFTPVTAGNVASGTQYEAFPLMSGASLYDVIGAINQALGVHGDIVKYIDYGDDNTLVTVTDTEEYALPAGVYNITNMWIGASTTAPYQWRHFSHWNELSGYLHIPYRYAGHLGNGYPLKLEYVGPHDVLDSYDDEIDPQVNPRWLTLTAAINLIRSLANRGANWSDYKTIYEEAQEKVITMRPLRRTVISVRGA